MNGMQPPPLPAKKSGMPTWALVLIIVGAVGLVGIFMVGMLAAIAIPNFVKARETAQRNACINNLRVIEGAKQQWTLENKKESSDTPTQAQVTTYLKNGAFPMCPAGGTYSINAGDQEPTCSISKHSPSYSPGRY